MRDSLDGTDVDFCDAARVTALEAEARAARLAVEALRGCWGQQEDGDLRFVVRVSGLGARAESAKELAERMTALWSETFGRGVLVNVDESSREALAAIDALNGGQK